MPRLDPLVAKYTLACSEPSCAGRANVEQSCGVGWKLGDLVQMDSTRLSYARCPQCKRHNMKVVQVPPLPPRPGPKGFSKIPTE